MQGELLDLVGDAGVFAGQETRAHAIGDGTQAKVEAGGLDLFGMNVLLRPNLMIADQRLDLLIRQDAGALEGGERRRSRIGAGSVREQLAGFSHGLPAWPDTS